MSPLLAKSDIEASIDSLFFQAYGHYEKDLDSTLFYLNQATTVAKKNGFWHLYLQATYEMSWCALYHYEIDTADYYIRAGIDALNQYPSAIEALDPDKYFTTGVFKAAGMYFYTLGDFQKALEEFLRIVPENTPPLTTDSSRIATTYEYIARIYYYTGNYEKELEYYQHALQWYSSDYDYDYYFAINQMHRGDYQLERDNYPLALNYYLGASNTFQKYHNNLRSKNALVTSYYKLASFYQLFDNYDSTFYYLNEVEKIQDEDDPMLLDTYLYLGDANLNFNNYDLANFYYDKSISLINSKFTGNYYKYVLALNSKGNVFARQKQYDTALSYYQKTLSHLVKNFDDSLDIYSNPAIDEASSEKELLNTLSLKADALYQWFEHDKSSLINLTHSLDTYHLATELVDKMRKGFQTNEFKEFLASKELPLYELAMDASYMAYQLNWEDRPLEKSFYFSEKNKSGVLLEAIKNSQAKAFAGIPAYLLEEEKRLQGKISYLKSEVFELQNEENEKLIQKIQQDIFQTQQDYQQLITRLEAEYPQYYQLKYNTIVASIAEIQDGLPDQKTALIEYFYGDSSLYIFGVNTHEAFLEKLVIDDIFDTRLHRFIHNVSDPLVYENEYDLTVYQQFIKDAHALYRELLYPVLSRFGTHIDDLIIVPDGKLGYLPFDILLTSTPSDTLQVAYFKLPYLLQDYQIRYEYSATLLLNNKLTNRKNDNLYAYAGFAPAYDNNFGEDSGWRSAYESSRGGFAPLINNQPEVKNISELFGGITFLGNGATEEAFKFHADSSNILHLAMHAFTHDTNPLYSGFVFAQSGNNLYDTLEEDGFLHTYELYNMQINAELALLSACETGIGELARGEGIISLARAFKYAGCPNVAMSLWKANDETTMAIMQQFCKNLKKGMEKDQALRLAKLSYLERPDKLHPYYWATFVLIGDDLPITSSASWPLYGIIAILLLLGMTIGWRLKFKK